MNNKKRTTNSNINNWINKLPTGAFIDKTHRRYIDQTIMEPLPLLSYSEPQWKKLFKEPPGKDYKKLQLTATGVYSIGQPDINRELILFVKELATSIGLNEKTITITETNGGLGGFSTALLQEFNNLNIVELNPTHYNIIKNNLEVYGFGKNNTKKITIYEADYLDKMFELKQDIIISDPPWGGRDYIKQQSIRLGFDNIDIVNVINELAAQNKFSLFIFLAPMNYNFNLFLSRIQAKTVYIRKARRHNLIAVHG